MRTSIRNAVISFTCLALTAQGPIAVAQAVSIAQTKIDPLPLSPLPTASLVDGPALPESFAELVTRAESLEPIIERLRAEIDHTQFDPTALNSSLDFDPEALARFVTEEIRFEQYRGVLRGAAGTLMGRAGNALDQSILLGHLLEEAGVDWRIAHGKLTREDAERLVRQMESARAKSPPAGDETEIRDALAELYTIVGYSETDAATIVQPDPEADRRFFAAATESDTRFIVDALKQAGVGLGDPDAMPAIIEEARDYYWVDYRVDAYDEWQSVHTAFPTEEAPLVAKADTFVTPPDDLYHRVRFEVFIEQKSKNELIVHPVVSRESRAAELIGKPIIFTSSPDSLGLDAAADMETMLEDTGFFLPSINTDLEGNAFDLDGRSISVGVFQLDPAGMTDVLRSQARQLESALGGLEGLGDPTAADDDPDDIFTLTAQWIQYTVIGPGGGEKTYRRYLVDRVGVVNRESGIAEIIDDTELTEAAKSLLTMTTLSVVTTRFPDSYLLHRFTERLANEISVILTATSAEEFDSVPVSLLEKFVPPADFMLAAAFDGGHDLMADNLSYRLEPTVVAVMQGETERVDIVHHARRFFDVAAGLRFDPVGAVRGGVWESYAEQSLLQTEDRNVIVTGDALRAAQQDGSEFHVLTRADLNSLDALNYSIGTTQDIHARSSEWRRSDCCRITT